MQGGVRGPGCQHDGGPLWVSIPLEDDPVVETAAGNPFMHTIWAHIYQKNRSAGTGQHPSSLAVSEYGRNPYKYSSRYDSRGRDTTAPIFNTPRYFGYGSSRYGRRSYYAQVDGAYKDNDDLVECLAVQVCTTTGAP